MYLGISEVCFWMLKFPIQCQIILPVLLKFVYSVYCDASCGQSSICQTGVFASAVRSRCFHELCVSGTMLRNLVSAYSPASCAQGANVQMCLSCITVKVLLQPFQSKMYVQLSC